MMCCMYEYELIRYTQCMVHALMVPTHIEVRHFFLLAGSGADTQ